MLNKINFESVEIEKDIRKIYDEGDIEHYINNPFKYVSRTRMRKILVMSIPTFIKLIQPKVRKVKTLTGYWYVHFQDCLDVAKALKEEKAGEDE